MKRTVACLAVVMMLIVSAICMIGCDKRAKVIPNDPITLPLEGGYELSVWMAWDNTYCPEYESLSDHPFFKRLEEKTGIAVEFVVPSNGYGAENIGALSGEWTAAIASDTMQDMVMHYYFCPSLSSGTTIDAAYEDEIYYILNDYVDVQMPNFKALRQKYSIIDKTMYTNMGNIMYIPSITGCADAATAPVTEGIMIRKDFLDELQLEVPVTIADWENVLRAFSLQGINYPLALGAMPLDPVVTGAAFLSAYGCDYKFYLGEDDGMVHYGAVENGMLEYSKLLNSWYTGGYINMDTAVTTEMKTSNDCGAWLGGIDDIANLKAIAADPNFEVVAAPYPVLNEGDKITVRAEYMPTGNYEYNSFYVTQACDRPDIACKWLDQLFSEESYNEASYGVKDEDYTIDGEGKITFTDKILGDPDGARYGVAKNCFLESPYCDRDVLINYVYDDAVRAAVETWSLATSERSLMRNTSWQYSAEEQETKDTLGNFWGIQTSNIKGFINGSKDFTEWDSYIAEMNDAGMELYIEIVQSAYDRFMAG